MNLSDKVYFDGKRTPATKVIRRMAEQGCEPWAIALFLDTAEFADVPEGPNERRKTWRTGRPGHYQYSDKPPGGGEEGERMASTTRRPRSAETAVQPERAKPDWWMGKAVKSNWMPQDQRGTLHKVEDYLRGKSGRVADWLQHKLYGVGGLTASGLVPDIGYKRRDNYSESKPQDSTWHAVGPHMVKVDGKTGEIIEAEANAMEPDWWTHSGENWADDASVKLRDSLVGTKMSDLFVQAHRAGQTVLTGDSSEDFHKARKRMLGGDGWVMDQWKHGIYEPIERPHPNDPNWIVHGTIRTEPRRGLPDYITYGHDVTRVQTNGYSPVKR